MNVNSGRVAVVAGMRTPFVKAGAQFRSIDQLKLSSHAVKGLVEKTGIDSAEIDELVWGRVLHDPRIPNLAREIVFDLKLPECIRAHLVSNNCITSIHAIVAVAESINAGRSAVGIAGGVESMSTVPMLFSREASELFLAAGMARSAVERVRTLLKLRPRHFKPTMLSFKEPSTGLSMGQHAEISAQKWQVDRKSQDEIAWRSHRRAAAATADGRLLGEIYPLCGVEKDTIVRGDTTLEKLAQLTPVFDRSEQGTITAGNASPLTDGAAGVLLMDDAYAAEHGYKPLAYIKEVEFAAINPDDGLLMAPCIAVPRLLQKTGLTLEDLAVVEVHEAFAAQVACNLAAWERGWQEPAIGAVDVDKLNPLGSSIAVGHPFAATGARIVTTLANEMQRRDARYGLVSICAAGAMAAAMILERD